MAQFNAATAVEKLDYDFTAFGGGSGTIPEPSTGQVQAFFDTIRSLAQEMRAFRTAKDGELTDSEAAEVISNMDDDMIQKYQSNLNNAIAELCSGTPSLEDIERLPYRVLSAFTAWISEQLRPEAQGPATKR